MSSVLSPILHVATGKWMLGHIDNHTCKEMSHDEIVRHIAEYEEAKLALAKASKKIGVETARANAQQCRAIREESMVRVLRSLLTESNATIQSLEEKLYSANKDADCLASILTAGDHDKERKESALVAHFTRILHRWHKKKNG